MSCMSKRPIAKALILGLAVLLGSYGYGDEGSADGVRSIESVDFVKKRDKSEISLGRAFYGTLSFIAMISESDYGQALDVLKIEMQAELDEAIKYQAEFTDIYSNLTQSWERVLRTTYCTGNMSAETMIKKLEQKWRRKNTIYENCYRDYKKTLSKEQAEKLEEWVKYRRRKMSITSVNYRKAYETKERKDWLMNRTKEQCDFLKEKLL